MQQPPEIGAPLPPHRDSIMVLVAAPSLAGLAAAAHLQQEPLPPVPFHVVPAPACCHPIRGSSQATPPSPSEAASRPRRRHRFETAPPKPCRHHPHIGAMLPLSTECVWHRPLPPDDLPRPCPHDVAATQTLVELVGVGVRGLFEVGSRGSGGGLAGDAGLEVVRLAQELRLRW